MSLPRYYSQQTTSLPLDILYLVTKYLPLDTRVLANLSLCSRSFYNTYNALLYRDIYIYTPTQLIQLYESQQSKNKLEITHALHIDEGILHDEAWVQASTTHSPFYYLAHVLQAMVSLRWFQVMTSSLGVTVPCGIRKHSNFSTELTRHLGLLLDGQPESFLPNLSLLSVSGDYDPFVKLLRSRPIMLYSVRRITGLDVHVGTNSSNVDLSEASVSESAYQEVYSNTPSSHMRPLSAANVGLFIKDVISAEPFSHGATQITDLDIKVLSHGVGELPPSINTPLPWIQGMLSALDHPQLKMLHIDYPEVFAEIPVNQQFLVILEVAKALPVLIGATVASPSITWHKGTGEMVIDDDVKELIDELGDQPSLIYPNLPDWTPMPNDPSEGVLAWWIDSLDLKLPSRQSPDMPETIEKLARQLMIGMLMRWPEGYYDLYDPMGEAAEYVHGEGQLEEAILELLGSSDTSETSETSDTV